MLRRGIRWRWLRVIGSLFRRGPFDPCAMTYWLWRRIRWSDFGDFVATLLIRSSSCVFRVYLVLMSSQVDDVLLCTAYYWLIDWLIEYKRDTNITNWQISGKNTISTKVNPTQVRPIDRKSDLDYHKNCETTTEEKKLQLREKCLEKEWRVKSEAQALAYKRVVFKCHFGVIHI